jgi:hypothetical protein
MEMEETRLDVGLSWDGWTLEAKVGGIAHSSEASGGRSSDQIDPTRHDLPSTASRPFATTSPLACLSSSHAMKSKITPSLITSCSRLACSQHPIDARVSTIQLREQR